MNDPELALHVLASGSKGNATIIEDIRTHHGILVDCGISKKKFLDGCAAVGFDHTKLDAIMMTHEHHDHTSGLGVVLRGLAKEGIHLPLYVDPAIMAVSPHLQEVQEQDLAELVPMRSGDHLSLGTIHADVFPTSHDAVRSYGFRFETDHDAAGFMTDTGIVTGQAHECLTNVRLLGLESNHDVKMLKTSFYPSGTKARIASDEGHLSNDQAAKELRSLLSDRLEQVVALHISQNTNDYTLSREGLRSVLAANDHPAQATVGYQSKPISIR